MRIVHVFVNETHKKLSGDQNVNGTVGHAGLGIEGGHLVLDLLEREALRT